jgi:hypothetical protein
MSNEIEDWRHVIIIFRIFRDKVRALKAAHAAWIAEREAEQNEWSHTLRNCRSLDRCAACGLEKSKWRKMSCAVARHTVGSEEQK